MSVRNVLWLFLILGLFLSCSPERGDWKEAKSQHSIEAYQAYLAKHPEGDHAVEARARIRKLYYDQAASANTIEAYEEFLKRYPKADLCALARGGIERLFYEQARSENRISAYEDYLKRYPDGRFDGAP